jgi:hypothetical protein
MTTANLLIALAIAAAAILSLVLIRYLQRRVGGYAPGWQVRCVKCGHAASAGSVGVIRIKAASLGNYTLGLCSHCKGLRLLAIERASA